MMNPNKVFGAHEKGILEHPKIGLSSRKNEKKLRKSLKNS
jgi:hypothetical protein